MSVKFVYYALAKIYSNCLQQSATLAARNSRSHAAQRSLAKIFAKTLSIHANSTYTYKHILITYMYISNSLHVISAFLIFFVFFCITSFSVRKWPPTVAAL